MEFYGIYPMLGPTGVQYWNMSIVDWIKSNSNYTQWTVNVRPGLKWSDGTNVTSADIIATYSPTFGFNPAYDFTGEHQKVTSVVPLNTSAVQFNLNQSDAHFIETISPLVLMNVLPKADANTNYTGFGTTQVVTGPFYAVNYQAGQTEMTMLRNPYFYTTGLPEPAACELDVNFVESTANAETYIKAGTTDIAEVDPSSVSAVTQNTNIHILSEPNDLIQSGTWNVTAYPFNESAFRQAMVYAINQSEIVQQAFAGYGTVAYHSEGTVPPTITGLYNSNQFAYSFNQSKAVQLLNSIGITKGSDGMLHYSNGTAVTISLWGDDSSSFDTVTVGIMQANLQQIGIQATTHLTSFANLGSFTTITPATIYVSVNHGAIFPDAAIDAQPGWNVYSEPTVVQPHWEPNVTADAEFQGNLTAINNTDNQSQIQQYLNNIQELNAANLPTFVTAWGDSLYAYNTQHWSGWQTFPQGWFHLNDNVDDRLLALLQPVSTSGTSTATTTTQPTATTTGGQPPTTTTSTTTSAGVATSSSSGGSNTTLIAIAAVIIIVIIAAAAAMFMRRGRKPAAAAP